MKYFATVATHEQPFNRFIEQIEEVAKLMKDDEFVVQYGYSKKPEGKNIVAHSFLSYKNMQLYTKKADCVITHAGPASIFDSLSQGIVPIVMPRYKNLGEHVNNHQVEFTNFLIENNYLIIPVFFNDNLKDKVLEYAKHKQKKWDSGNKEKFNKQLQLIINNLVSR